MTELFHRVHHGQNILWRNVVHYRMNRTDHTPTTRAKRLNYAPYFLSYLDNATVRQDAM
jgi:hypothetical protein